MRQNEILLMCRRFGDTVGSEGEEGWEINNPLPFEPLPLSLQKKIDVGDGLCNVTGGEKEKVD